MYLALSLCIPLLEVALVGRSYPFGMFTLAYAALTTMAVYSWYRSDQAERNVPVGSFQDIAIILLYPVALPVYLFRSRGTRSGAIASTVAIGIFCLGMALSFAGEWGGAALRSRGV